MLGYGLMQLYEILKLLEDQVEVHSIKKVETDIMILLKLLMSLIQMVIQGLLIAISEFSILDQNQDYLIKF